MRPEQQRALDYVRRKGTEADPESIRQRLVAAFGELEASVDSLDARAARRRPASGGWCVQEIVDHLVESHRRAARQLDALVSGRPPGDAIPASLLSADPLAHDWDDLVATLKKVHADVLGAFAKGDASTSLEWRAPVVFVVKVREDDGSLRPREWIEEADWKAFALGIAVHTREHVDQIRRTLAG